MSSDERRYTEEEFAEILRRAGELQTRAPEPDRGSGSSAVSRPRGLSLAEMEAIAEEVGIDADLVRRAAATVGTDDLIFEGVTPSRFLLKRSVSGALDRDDLGRILAAVRDAGAMHGETTSTVSGVEWKTGEVIITVVSADSVDDRTELRVRVDASSAKVLSHLLPGFAGAFGGAILGSALEPGVGPGIALMAASLATGLGVGNLIWRQTLRRARRAAARLFRAGEQALPTAAHGAKE